MAQVLFEQPNSPEEFGVALAPAELRKLDFSALDYETLSRAAVEYIRTYYPNEFNDFFASNGIIMMIELMAYMSNVVTERGDILIDEAFLPTAQTKEAVIEHLALINQKIITATPAVVDIEITISNPVTSEIRVPAGMRFSVPGPDSQPVYYELFRSPGDFTSYISIPPGKRGIVGYGIEGLTATPLVVTSAGGTDQYIDILDPTVLAEPITVEVATGNSVRFWDRVAVIEKSGPNDQVFEVRQLGDRTRIIFGDNQAGKAPLAGQIITIRYRTGGGVRGRIAANAINETQPIAPQPPASAAVEVLFRNPTPSSGGTDEENIEQAKKRAPREYATHGNAVSGEDYGWLASQFRHPVFGAVAKAIGVVLTGVEGQLDEVAKQVRAAPTEEAAQAILLDSWVNTNIVQVFALAEGPGGILSKPSSGLKQGLTQYLSERNVLTDEVRVYDGAVKPVNVSATVIIARNSDPGTTKVAVIDALNSFFDIRNFDMGTGLYLSNLYQLFQSVPGVKFVDIYDPPDDIIATNKIGDPTSKGVGYNEVVTLGQVDVKFYFEPGNYRVPPVGKI